MENNILILVACHNQQKILETDSIKAILVGAENSKLDIYSYKDNIYDNISVKNPDFNELTAQYWAWKNMDKAITHVGFFHYRRYLSLKRTIFPKKLLPNFPKLMSCIFGFTDKNLKQLITDFDIVLPQKTDNLLYINKSVKRVSLKEHFNHHHSSNVVNEVENIILEKFPQYQEALYFSYNEKKSYYKNIFIMNRAYFNDYMNFMFSILFEFEAKNLDNKITSQKRINGFIAERLLNIYINHLVLSRKNPRIAKFSLLRVWHINIFTSQYFTKQWGKLKRRVNADYIKFIFSKLIKRG
ncbi:MAG: DUF4422 domain-containing protein [Alphaproteobacteria bacterium]|jgi:hypothetical protein|nr:DUF4422 domain-containing protein [Alphaproteobacteria bacterium]